MIHVLQDRIEDARGQHQFTPHATMGDFLRSQSGSLHVVGSPDENKMHQKHADGQWENTDHHDFVLGEEALDANIAAAKSRNNYSQ